MMWRHSAKILPSEHRRSERDSGVQAPQDGMIIPFMLTSTLSRSDVLQKRPAVVVYTPKYLTHVFQNRNVRFARR